MKLSTAFIFLMSTTFLTLSGCGGSSTDAMPAAAEVSATVPGIIANDSDAQPTEADQIDSQQMADIQSDSSEQQAVSCAFEFDVADLVVTEADRQWSCEVVSDQGSRFEDVYFLRSGTVIFGDDLRYWSRNLPFEQINVASPASGYALISEIRSSNTLMSFIMIPESGMNLLYECVLTPRQTTS